MCAIHISNVNFQMSTEHFRIQTCPWPWLLLRTHSLLLKLRLSRILRFNDVYILALVVILFTVEERFM